MASVFTYDPDPPKISSPWSNTPVSTPLLKSANTGDHHIIGGLVAASPFLLEGSGIAKLDPEPQDGPVEYKLHLLLRPRTHHFGISPSMTSTTLQQLKLGGSINHAGTADRQNLKSSSVTPPLQVRQKRLEHLTTQLLWRLQQSSPYHSQSTLKLVPPSLPESGPVLSLPTNAGKLLPGLEESMGALYEIGVTDDGAFIGLTKEEMDESLINLRSMAASLGCKVEILKTVIVGQCEEDHLDDLIVEVPRKLQSLWVVEALVLPNTHQQTSDNAPASPIEPKPLDLSKPASPLHLADFQTEQLRVSLTGSTTSGKSSLVGTLSTSSLDSGRGKTRLSLLKHRHEIESGVTSSVAPELIGYHTDAAGEVQVVNYGFGNISSWNDIHNAAEGERLVFLLDSAGHPRYRRTAVRGLVSWAPHWTLCCVAADETEDFAFRPATASEDSVGNPTSSADASSAHLDLCLKLDLRLVVVITKLDAATNVGLRNTLSKVLSIIKTAGRNPILLKPDPSSRTTDELQTLSTIDIEQVESIFDKNDASTIVPIVLTSAVRGSGIRQLHALLRCIPVSVNTVDLPRAFDQDAVFYIDEVFAKHDLTHGSSATSTINILSGHLRHGDVEIGDQVLLGPYTIDTLDPRPVELGRARSYPSRMSIDALSPNLSRSAPKIAPLVDANFVQSTRRTISEAPTLLPQLLLDIPSAQEDEWLSARITSIRNLRLPLCKLLAGQVGTIGVELVTPLSSSTNPNTAVHKLRKGMVLIKQKAQSPQPQACSGIKVILASSCYNLMEPGALFTIYIASIRASAKILSVEIPSDSLAISPDKTNQAPSHKANGQPEQNGDDVLFLFDDPDSVLPAVTYSESGRREVRYQPPLSPNIEASFLFVSGREWVQSGSKVLVMSTAIVEGSSGLDGVVGSVSKLL